MAETFYSVLGVEPGVDGEAVERAYRERVKEVHPDVADDPDAPREFARLTVARDVLVDDEERGRYDDLGHAAYVRAHVDASVWAAEDDATDADASGADADGTDTGGTDAAAASTGTTTEPDAAGATTSGTTAPGQSAAAASGVSETTAGRGRRGRRQRGTAAAYHRVGSEDVVGRERDPLWRRVVAVGRRVGPWALVHLVLVASAAATAWFGYAGAAHLDMSLPALAVAVVVLVVTLLASAAHLLSRVYA
ncbi:DnaJ domain-containing protein [Salinirussus salinus]|uniref:DnaJ domain-containing protein n=1 Tax=Salinirussus salinus TaxID=1198300 RepID=UPI001915A158|nr:DnaJ domain-containing protein [Salinirussus salinus]